MKKKDKARTSGNGARLEVNPCERAKNVTGLWIFNSGAAQIWNRSFWACMPELNRNLTGSVNSRDNSGSYGYDNGLHFAVREGKLDTAVFLIEQLEMDPSIEGRNRHNAFWCACYSKNHRVKSWGHADIFFKKTIRPVVKRKKKIKIFLSLNSFYL